MDRIFTIPWHYHGIVWVACKWQPDFHHLLCFTVFMFMSCFIVSGRRHRGQKISRWAVIIFFCTVWINSYCILRALCPVFHHPLTECGNETEWEYIQCSLCWGSQFATLISQTLLMSSIFSISAFVVKTKGGKGHEKNRHFLWYVNI